MKTARDFRFRCLNRQCGAEFDARKRLYQCADCGDLLDIIYDFPEWDPAKLRHHFHQRRISNHVLDRSGVWRFREFLPFHEEDYPHVLTLEEGNCPVLEAPASAKYVGLQRLRIKQLGWNPTGSFKDYGMTVAATQAQKLGCRLVACASTGNTSASMAAYTARSSSLRGVVFIPEGQISYGKLSQTLDYGALTVQIEGDFDRAMRLVREIADEMDVYLMNSINPFRLEGQKAIVLELFDQLDWKIPDRIVVPGGNLGNSSSFGKALIELRQTGLIEKTPRITIIQASGAAPLYNMLEGGLETILPVEKATTLASAIKIGAPVSWKKALRSLQFTDGWCDRVSEEEIAVSKAVLGRDGIGCEPASATTVAGIKKLVTPNAANVEWGGIDPGEDVVAFLTGHQLKDPDYTVKYHLGELEVPGEGGELRLSSKLSNRPVRVKADKEAIREVLTTRS